MKAIVLEEKKGPLVFKEVPDPVPASGSVVVHLRAAALNHRDVWITKGKYPGIKVPIILGSDGAGMLNDQEVLINPGQAWGDNPAFQSKDFHILGLPKDGTLAQQVAVPATYVHPKPAHLSFTQAAALPLAGLTAYRVLFSRCGLQADETVLITGIGGGVAQFALQFAVAKGAEVYVTSGSDEKLAKASELGASGGANYRQEDWADQLKAKAGGFDVIIDGAAGPGFNDLVKIARLGGRVGIYGGTQGAIPGLVPQRIFWKQLSIYGSTMGNEGEFADMLAFVSENKIVPVVDEVFDLPDAPKAFERMEKGLQFGKLVIRIPST